MEFSAPPFVKDEEIENCSVLVEVKTEPEDVWHAALNEDQIISSSMINPEWDPDKIESLIGHSFAYKYDEPEPELFDIALDLPDKISITALDGSSGFSPNEIDLPVKAENCTSINEVENRPEIVLDDWKIKHEEVYVKEELEQNEIRKGFSLEGILQIIYNDDLPVDFIYVEPPEPSSLTDEESGNEDNNDCDINKLSSRQLTAGAEIVLLDGTRIISRVEETNLNVDEEDEDKAKERDKKEAKDQESNQNEQMEGKKIFSASFGVDKDFFWIDGDLEIGCKSYPGPNYEPYYNLSPVELFELYFDEDIVKHLVTETRNYTLYKNYPDQNISFEDIKCFVGILILSGYTILPGKRCYWDSRGDMHIKMVAEAMRKDRFCTILRFIHCANNNAVDENDKFYKLRPLVNMLNKRFLKYFVPERNANYDESMIKYFDHRSSKRGKPITFGFKMWCVNAASGYLINCDMYQGKNRNCSPEDDKFFGKCTAPFISMLAEISKEKPYPYNFFFDSIFTNFNLLVYLRESGFTGTGTIRDDRLPKDCPLSNKKLMSKRSKRGTHKSTLERKNGILLTRWLDNNVVTIATTAFGTQPTSKIKRYSKSDKKFIQIDRPFVVGEYNKGIRGTDVMDAYVNRYRCSISSKKWWWSIFSWLIDVSIMNAWILYRKSGRPMTQLEFKREIVQVYLTRYGNLPKTAGRPSVSKNSITLNRVSDDISVSSNGFNKEERKNDQTKDSSTVNRPILVHRSFKKCGEFSCDHCDYKTLYKGKLKSHLLRHEPPKEGGLFKCDQCDYTTRGKLALIEHLLRQGKPTEEFKCDRCDFKTIYKNNLKGHLLVHKVIAEEDLLKCHRCEYRTPRTSLLKVHLSRHNAHDNKALGKAEFRKPLPRREDTADEFRCDQCDFKTLYKGCLTKHASRHRILDDAKTFKCDLCDFKTFGESYLRRHMLRHLQPRDDNMFKCYNCDFTTTTKASLKRHVLRHANAAKTLLECKECDFKTLYNWSFTKHAVLHKHPIFVRAFECDKCDFRTPDKCNLKRHAQQHENREDVSTFGCDMCDYKTPDKSSLKRHAIRHTSPKNATLLKCDQCDFKILDRVSLKRHALRHRSPKYVDALRCSECGFKALDDSKLKKHMLRHANVTLKCDKCNFKTSDEGSLKRHQGRHATPKVNVFKCDQCEFRTHYRWSFQQHALRHKT